MAPLTSSTKRRREKFMESVKNLTYFEDLYDRVGDGNFESIGDECESDASTEEELDNKPHASKQRSTNFSPLFTHITSNRQTTRDGSDVDCGGGVDSGTTAKNQANPYGPTSLDSSTKTKLPVTRKFGMFSPSKYPLPWGVPTVDTANGGGNDGFQDFVNDDDTEDIFYTLEDSSAGSHGPVLAVEGPATQVGNESKESKADSPVVYLVEKDDKVTDLEKDISAAMKDTETAVRTEQANEGAKKVEKASKIRGKRVPIATRERYSTRHQEKVEQDKARAERETKKVPTRTSARIKTSNTKPPKMVSQNRNKPTARSAVLQKQARTNASKSESHAKNATTGRSMKRRRWNTGRRKAALRNWRGERLDPGSTIVVVMSDETDVEQYEKRRFKAGR